MPPEPGDAAAPVVVGSRRPGPSAWIGIGLVLLVSVMMSSALWRFAGEGPWPVPIVWAVGALVAARLLTAREVRVARDGVAVTHRLFRWQWTRRWPAAAARSVRVRCDHLPSRHQHGDGTPEGEAALLMFTATLNGRPRLTLAFSRDVRAVESLARRVAGVLRVPALRRGYVRRASDGLPLRVRGATDAPLG